MAECLSIRRHAPRARTRAVLRSLSKDGDVIARPDATTVRQAPGNVVDSDVNGNAALEDRQGEFLGFQLPLIGANERRQVRTGRVTRDEDRFRVATELVCMIVNPSYGFGDVHLPSLLPSRPETIDN